MFKLCNNDFGFISKENKHGYGSLQNPKKIYNCEM